MLPSSTISTASLAADPNVAVALVSDTLKANANAHFVDSPSLDYTNIPTRLTCLLPTSDSLRNLLDALATVSSSTSPDGNETIVCALRLDSDHSLQPAVELILSSHEPIRGGTVRHIQETWRQMLVISKLPHKRGADRESFIHLITNFRHTMYAYTLRKLRVEFTRHMAVIDKWRVQNTAATGHLVADLRSGDDAHFRMPLVEALFHLDRCRSAFASMREDDQEPKRLISTAHNFMSLVAALELAKDSVDKLLLHVISLRVLSVRCFQCKYVLGNAFECITSFPRHIVNLLHFAANNMDSLHTHDLVLTLVSPLTSVVKAPCPRTKRSWKAIREYILTEKGVSYSPDHSKPASISLVVHGELNIVTYLHALHFQHIETIYARGDSGVLYPAPYNYIAASVPPCTPSILWIDAYNARHARRGDGVRFDIAYDPVMRWSGPDTSRRRWGWAPLPQLPVESVDRPRRRILPDEIAEKRIVAAAWDFYAQAVIQKSEVEERAADPARGLNTHLVLESRKAWGGPPLQTRWPISDPTA